MRKLPSAETNSGQDSGTSQSQRIWTAQSSDGLSVWSVFQMLLPLLDNLSEPAAMQALALMTELATEPTISAELTVAAQWWTGATAARTSLHHRLEEYRLKEFYKIFETAQSVIFAHPEFYGGPRELGQTNLNP